MRRSSEGTALPVANVFTFSDNVWNMGHAHTVTPGVYSPPGFLKKGGALWQWGESYPQALQEYIIVQLMNHLLITDD